jgi:hypothetical protein
MGRVTTGTLHQALRLRRQARAARLPELDRFKEEVAYLKLWPGVAVVTFISLMGWLVTNGAGAPAGTFARAIAGVAFLGIGILVLGRQIARRIKKIGMS